MSARRYFIATMTDSTGAEQYAERFAWNAAIRASEDMVRTIARDAGETYSADRPEVYGKPATLGATYRRTWTGDETGALIRIEVCEVAS